MILLLLLLIVIIVIIMIMIQSALWRRTALGNALQNLLALAVYGQSPY